MKSRSGTSECPLPDHALLARYTRGGGYADCYTTQVAWCVTHAQFVEAFYTGAVFKIERLLIRWFLSRPSTDVEVRQLAAGERSTFAAWRVEERTANQLLMCDIAGSTRSWLMVSPTEGSQGTRLFFGSAVVPMVHKPSGQRRMSFLFKALLGFHKVYSRVLLGSARSRLVRAQRTRGR